MKPLLPPGATQQYLDVKAGRLRVLHSGEPSSACPIVLIHGGGTDAAGISWYRLMQALGEHREVWAIDLPGFGGSNNVTPVGGPRELAQVVIDVMDALEISRAVVCGVSMGGDIALNIALDQLDRVAGLVLIGSGGLVPIYQNRAAQYGAWLAGQLPDWVLLPATRVANLFSRVALRAVVNDPTTLPAEVTQAFIDQARDPLGNLGYLRYNQATLGPTAMTDDVSDRVHEVTVPTLIFHGEDDRLVPVEGSRRAAQNMTDAKLVIAPACGHWAQLEAHDLFVKELDALLSRVDQALP